MNAENRTFTLDSQTKIELCRLSQLGAEEAGSSIQALLPSELSPEEIDSVGIQVSNLRETIDGSWDGLSRGAKMERDVVRSIGFAAVADGDTTTAESVISHLKKNKLSVSNWLAIAIIRWDLRGSDAVGAAES